MAEATHTTPSRFHNLSVGALADMIGRADATAKAAEAELKALKGEFIARGLTSVGGKDYVVTATAQVSWRLDTKAVREHLGDAASRFETIATTNVVRVRDARVFDSNGNRIPAGARAAVHDEAQIFALLASAEGAPPPRRMAKPLRISSPSSRSLEAATVRS